MKRLEKKHPLAIRWFHWINFPLLGVMIWSGLLIYWANSVYRVGVGEHTLVKLFPQGFFAALNLSQRLAEGMAFHFFFMWLFAANGLLYVIYTVVSGEWRQLVPDARSLRDALLVTLHDLHLRREKPPQGRYNGAQKISYTAIVLMGGGSLLTGLAIYKPAQFNLLTALLGGYEWARWEHFWLTVGYVAFFVVHVLQVARAGWSNFRSMVSGYEVVNAEEATVQEATR
ncbi:MAG: cytochrome b/b6 domain-containing protein [Pyrinomonadaceae bacterium]